MAVHVHGAVAPWQMAPLVANGVVAGADVAVAARAPLDGPLQHTHRACVSVQQAGSSQGVR